MKLALPARPKPVEIDPAQTAVLLVDMQNAFASKGGMLDLAGIDVAGAQAAIANARRLIDAAHGGDIPVIYLVMGYPPDQSTGGGEDSPNPQKELALCLMRERPELRGTLLTFGTWDFQIVDELVPRAGDPVIVKSRYSGFHATRLDALLRERGIRYLLMAGIASNVCVESTLRDAYFHEYWPIMVEDATMAGGPPEIQQATIYNVMTFFGWVTTTSEVASALTMKRFQAEIEEGRGGGAYVVVPFGVAEAFGTRGQLRVKGTIDGQPFKSSMAPMGGGHHVLGLHKATRDAIGKSVGDTVTLEVQPDTEERTVIVPNDFRKALATDPVAKQAFDRFAYTHRKEYVGWIESAKRPETRQRRITDAVSRISKGMKFS